MAKVYISIGSNIRRYHHIAATLEELMKCFQALEVSKIYESIPVGFSGDNFLNFVASFKTEIAPEQLRQQFRRLEQRFGRQRTGSKFGPRTLDIDILLVDNFITKIDSLTLPNPEIKKYIFVLKPLVDIAPTAKDPLSGKSYQHILSEHPDNLSNQCWPVPFKWRNRLTILPTKSLQ